MGDVDDPFVDGNTRAEREYQHRDHEAPEVELAAVAERVVLIGRLLSLAPAPHQQQLIGRIDKTVDALREHRRRPGNRGGDELRNRDSDVRSKRDNERSGTGGVGAHASRKFTMFMVLRVRVLAWAGPG